VRGFGKIELRQIQRLSNEDYQQMTVTVPGVVDKMLYIKNQLYTGILKVAVVDDECAPSRG
jgi:hypothetical protein